MERREFLGHGLLTGAGALVGLGLDASPARAENPAPGAAPVRGRRRGHAFGLSLAAYSFRKLLTPASKGAAPRMTLEECIDFCAGQDLDGVELTSYFFPETGAEYLARLKRRAFVNGLAITGVPVGNNFCLPPGEERRKQLEHVRKWVDHAAFLGAPCVRIFAGNTPRGETEERAVAWCLESLREACAHAGSRGVVLALENHGGITARARQLRHLVEATDSPWLGINLDTGNFREDAYEQLEAVADLAVVVQHKVEIHDGSGKKVPTDLDRIVKMLVKVGYRGVVALEYEAAGNPLEEVPRHLDLLRSALEKA